MPAARREPQRTCIGCREAVGRRSLVRLVRVAEGGVAVEVPGQRLSGRGAYLHRSRSCWESAFQGATIGKALRMSPKAGDIEGLRRYIETNSGIGVEEV
ncbi:MAG: nucleic acid-binding protein [Dehalococcoidia bacterium]|nr:nucleic acid-binding protein [Dehalococcoidia bacterium]HCV00988.1 DUF448 domain-containing protein [Dehalococcoidia bacterium]